ncbi:sensor histidine kinase [Streptomyces sp. NPDC101062]|uniref:sensor histidine kinase n=1 Tax=unclassified Streptomyces TaxID=2593676 RepID=UPI0038292DF1
MKRLPRLPRPRQLTIRVRLTLLYAALFMAAGVILLGITYLLIENTLGDKFTGVSVEMTNSAEAAPPEGASGRTAPREGLNVRKLETGFLDATLRSLLSQGVIALGVLTVVATVFGYLMAARVLRPLHHISETAGRISRGNLGERLAFSGPHDEIKNLADTFDSMMEQLQHAFDDQQRFVSDASHELRTPLAINRTLIEVALRKKDASDDAQRLGGALLVVNERHERLINGLLALAKGDREIRDRSTVDLADIAGHIAELRRGEADELGVRLRLFPGPAPASGDPVMLERIVHNLVENAIRYNHPGGWLSVRSAVGPGGTAVLTVINTGPTVPGYDMDAIFQPFRRLRADRVDSERGSGLGLAIVRNMARAHGGDVTAVPRERGGLVVTVRLPGAAPVR